VWKEVVVEYLNLFVFALVFISGGAVGWGTDLQAGRSQVRFPMV
jgi:hypothetical protein